MTALLSTPLTPFLVALLVGLALLAWARRRVPARAASGSPASREPYVGGEAAPAPARPSFHLFHLAIFYTVLHVAALVVVTATGAPWLALGYLAIVLVAVLALVMP